MEMASARAVLLPRQGIYSLRPMWRLRGACALLAFSVCMSQGKLLPEEQIASRHLGGSRSVRLYLPPSYERALKRRYPVLYLHDGQNVFSSSGPHCCFGWGSWELDRTADRLAAEGRMQEIIMVAIDNTRSRYKEYRGRIHLEGVKAGNVSRGDTNLLDNAKFDAYANFLIQELKPKIDRQYRTLKTSANTGVMGSSLGGICSVSLAWEYPKVFGRAASLSGSFHIEKRNFLEQVLRRAGPARKTIRFYLDSGTIDFTGDDDDRRYTDAVADELRRLGWKDGRNLERYTETRPYTDQELEKTGLPFDKWHEAQRSQHNEFYWRMRAWRALMFLFPET
jgi:predicted alpha/beta superfamily hydrolase